MAYTDTGNSDIGLAHIIARDLLTRIYVERTLDKTESTSELAYILNTIASSSSALSGSELKNTSSYTKYKFLRYMEAFLQDNWDGMGADAISVEDLNRTANLLDSLPERFQNPDVAPGGDGSICMEWHSIDRAKKVFVDIGPKKKILTYSNSPRPIEEHFTDMDAAKSHTLEILRSAGV